MKREPPAYIHNLDPDQDRIETFDCFVVMLASLGDDAPWKEHWQIFEQHDGVCFYRLSRDQYFSNVTMSFKILVNKRMDVVIFKNEQQADYAELNWILKFCKLEWWSQFHRLLEYYSTEPLIESSVSQVHYIERALEAIDKFLYFGGVDCGLNEVKQQLESVLLQLNGKVKKEVDEDQESVVVPEFLSFEQSSAGVEIKSEPIDDTVVSQPAVKKPDKEAAKKKTDRRKRGEGSVDEIIKCEQCDKIFRLKALYRRHVKETHASSYLIRQVRRLDHSFLHRLWADIAIVVGSSSAHDSNLESTWRYTKVCRWQSARIAMMFCKRSHSLDTSKFDMKATSLLDGELINPREPFVKKIFIFPVPSAEKCSQPAISPRSMRRSTSLVKWSS